MDTVFTIIGWLSIPVTVLSVTYMVVTWRRQHHLSAWSLWAPILISVAALLVYVGLIGVDPSPVRSWLPFFVAIGLGLWLGHSTAVELSEGAPLAARNPWSFLVWAGSFTATQLVALLAPGSTEAVLSLLFAATGLTVGEQLALVATRANVLGAARRAGAAAAAVFVVVVAFGAMMSPRTGAAADVTGDLGDVAGMTMDDGSENLPSIDGVKVDIKGTPEGTYSGPSIDVTIANDTADTLKIRVPVGTKLYPADVGIQTMLTAGNEVIVVPPGEVVTKRIQAYCGEPHDGPPSDRDTFTVGETEMGRTQRSLEAIVENQDEILDPSTGLTTTDAQRVVWMNRFPEEYEPMDTSDPAYELYEPKPSGPSSEESGKAGVSSSGIAGAGAVVTGRRSTGSKRRNGTAKPKPKTNPEPGSPEEFHELMNQPADDGPATKTESKSAKQPEPGSVEEFEELVNQPADDGPATKPKPETKTEPEAENASGTEPETKPEAEPESKPDKAGAVDPDSDTKVTATSGGTRVTVDPAAQAGEFETSKATGSYDAANNVGKFRKKDGSVKIDTHRRGGQGEFKGKHKTTKVTVERTGDTKTLDAVQERKGGGRSRLQAKLTPRGNDFKFQDGPDTIIVKTRPGGSSLFRHTHPSGHVEVRRGPGGTGVSAQQRLRAAQNAWFRATIGVEHSGGVTNPSLRVDHDFDVRLPLPGRRRVRVPLTATVHQTFGPGSDTTATVGVRVGGGRRGR